MLPFAVTFLNRAFASDGGGREHFHQLAARWPNGNLFLFSERNPTDGFPRLAVT